MPTKWANLYKNNCTCAVSKCKSPKSKHRVQMGQGLGLHGAGPNRAFLHIFDLYTKQRLLLLELPVSTIITSIMQLLSVSKIFC